MRRSNAMRHPDLQDLDDIIPPRQQVVAPPLNARQVVAPEFARQVDDEQKTVSKRPVSDESTPYEAEAKKIKSNKIGGSRRKKRRHNSGKKTRSNKRKTIKRRRR